jgi:hypothetical protein
VKQSPRTVGIDGLGLKPSFGIVWHVTLEVVFAILPLATRWSVVHTTAFQSPDVFRTFSVDQIQKQSKTYQSRDVARYSASLALLGPYIVSRHHFKFLWRKNPLIFSQIKERYCFLVTSCSAPLLGYE